MEQRIYEAKTVEGKIKERFENIHNVNTTAWVDEEYLEVYATTYVEDNLLEVNFGLTLGIDNIDDMIEYYKEYVNFYQEIIDALDETKLIIEGEI